MRAHTHTHTHTHTHAHTYAYTHMHAGPHRHIIGRIQTQMHIQVHILTYTHKQDTRTYMQGWERIRGWTGEERGSTADSGGGGGMFTGIRAVVANT